MLGACIIIPMSLNSAAKNKKLLRKPALGRCNALTTDVRCLNKGWKPLGQETSQGQRIVNCPAVVMVCPGKSHFAEFGFELDAQSVVSFALNMLHQMHCLRAACIRTLRYCMRRLFICITCCLVSVFSLPICELKERL